MIGASKDTVVSWENGRNKLSESFARRIACATGVDGRFLLQGTGTLFRGSIFEETGVYTAEDFKWYRQTPWGRSDEEGARHHLGNCADALKLIFMAAGRAGAEQASQRLPGVLDSFMRWCEETRRDFELGPQIDEALGKRKFKMGVTQSYRAWREQYRQDPAALTAVGFKDDPGKKNSDELRLEMEGTPGWAPGRSMKAPNPAVRSAVVPKESGKTKVDPPSPRRRRTGG